MRYDLDGLVLQASTSTSRTSCKTGSIRWETVDEPSAALVKKLVRQDRMQTLVSGRTLDNVVGKISMLPQGRTWQLFKDGLARKLFLLTWFRMFESPRSEKTLDCAMMYHDF